MILAIVTSLRHFLGWTVSAFSSRQNLIFENLALRQQLLALHAKRPRRRLTTLQKLFWVVLLRLWSEWERALVLVTPRTVVGWHRAGFRLYGTWVSRARRVGGRRRVSSSELLPTPLTPRLSWTCPFHRSNIRASDRPNHFALPHRREARGRRHGRGL